MAHYVSDMGWVDFDLDVPRILPTYFAHSAYLSSAQAESGRQWNIQHLSQPNLGPRRDGPPCMEVTLTLMSEHEDLYFILGS